MPLDELVDAPPTDTTGKSLIEIGSFQRTKSLLESGRRIVQSMDPPGVGGRDLKSAFSAGSDDAAYAGHIWLPFRITSKILPQTDSRSSNQNGTYD